MLTAEQAQARRRGIGGSEVAAIAGLSPWKTPLDVYYAKVEGEDSAETPAMHWGTVLEDAVAQEYARVTGHKLRRVNRVLAHPEHPYILASLDRQIVAHPDGPGVLEIKTVGRLGDDWGEPGSDRIPEHYALQVHQYLTVTGYTWAHLAALFLGERELRIYRLEADPELSAWLIELERRFWIEHVERRIPPAPQSLGDLTRLYPRDTGASRVATAEQSLWVSRLQGIKAELSRLEGEKTALEIAVKQAMGEAAALLNAEGKPLVTWKTHTARRLDQKALKAAHPEIAEQFLADSTSRVFRLKESAA